jgi:HK97 family phage prohead protease
MLTLQGYAHVFYSHAEDRDFVFAPGCFDWSLEYMKAQRLLYDHQGVCLLASRRDGSLELFADDVGLGFQAHVQPRAFTSLRLDLRSLGCSFRARRADVRTGYQAHHRTP